MDTMSMTELCSASLQAQERLHLALKDKYKEHSCHHFVQKSAEQLESLRQMKSELEGTACKLKHPSIAENTLSQLRQLVLMHVPRSLTPDVKANITDMVCTALQGQCEEVLFICLVTCPWYESTQTDRGLAAKHNSLMVVFTHSNEQVLSPINPHTKQQASIIDSGWFYGTEVGHFAKYVASGKSRFIEALYAPEEAIIHQTNQWRNIHQCLDKQAIQGLRGFLEQCRGQAVGAVGRKAKSGAFKLRDASTLYEFCESFRLLHHAHMSLNQESIVVFQLNPSSLPSEGQEGLDIIKKLFEDTDTTVSKTDLFNVLMQWKGKIDTAMKHLKQFTPTSIIDSGLTKWITPIRLHEGIPRLSQIDDTSRHKVAALLQSAGPALSKINPDSVVLIARAGSFLYNLHTPQSDTDYLIIYKAQLEDVLCSPKKLVECQENRGPDKLVEYGAYELRLFCEMLLKGSVVVTELLFVDSLEYQSEAWKELAGMKEMFITEHLINQYLGLIRNNLHTLESGRHKDDPRERKLFYQIFHKSSGVSAMLDGNSPPVFCTGGLQNFIMSIRKQPLEGDLSRESLLLKAKDTSNGLLEKLSNRTSRLPEFPHYDKLLQWLTKARGFQAHTEHLS